MFHAELSLAVIVLTFVGITLQVRRVEVPVVCENLPSQGNSGLVYCTETTEAMTLRLSSSPA